MTGANGGGRVAGVVFCEDDFCGRTGVDGSE